MMVVVFSPDGSRLATSSLDGTVLLWDVHRREPIGPSLPGPSDIATVGFTPDGRYVVAIFINGSVFVWDLNLESWKDHACRVAGRNLTRAEWEELLPDRPYVTLCPAS